MDPGQIRPKFTAYRSAQTAVLFALGMACGPALASSSVAPCDEGAGQVRNLDAPAIELSIRAVDLGSAESVDAGAQRLDKPIQSRQWESPSLTPRAESIVQKMFEDPQYSPPSALTPLPADAHKSAPVAEALTPRTGGNKTEQQDTVDTVIQDEELNGVTTRLPGVTADDLVRFKRQMYRTDI